jgi:hypothetical protein
MSRKLLATFACLVFCSVAYALAPAPAPVERPRWEYKITNLNQDELNKLGDDGWELVSTTSEVSSQPGRNGVQSITSNTRLLLKRRK